MRLVGATRNGVAQQPVALVTGANRGIGRGIAIALASAGAKLFVVHFPSDTAASEARALVDQISAAGGVSEAVAGDLSQDESSSLLRDWLARREQPSILVNNAGVMQAHYGLATNVEDFSRCFAVNVIGIWRMSILFAEMQNEGPACIINMGSGAGRRGSAEKPAYDASKAAVISLTQSLAQALAPRNITVNCVCPGIVRTAMCEQFAALDGCERTANEKFEAFEQAAVRSIPLGRLQTIEDVGRIVSFLASEHARNITGQTINVDGGIMMF